MRPLESSLDYYRKGYQLCVESGQWTYAVYGALHYVAEATTSGRSLRETYEIASDFTDFMRRNAVSYLDNFMKPAGSAPRAS